MVIAVFASCGKAEEPVDTDPEVTTEAEETTGAPEGSTEEATTEPEVTTEAEEPLVMKDYELSSFKIVYNGSYLADIAEVFADEIMEIANVELDVVADNGEASGYEFIIGRAERDISEVCFDHKSFKHAASAGIYCDDGKVQFLGLDRNTIRTSIDYFFNNVLTEESQTVSLPEEGGLCEKIDPASLSIPVKADASQFRMVTNNVLMHYYTEKWGVSEKQSRIAELVGAYALYDADIIALQEVDAPWYSQHGLTNEMESLGYSLVSVDTGYVSNNANPLYYKTSRFNLLECGFEEYDSSSLPGGPYEGRWYTWAVLEEKTTGKQLVVSSTHFVAGLTNVSGEITELYRQESARQLVAFEASMRSKYPNAVVLMAGDYNSRLDSEAHSIMSASLNSARDTAEKKVNMNYDTSTSLGKKPGRGNPPSVIDHIFYTKTDKITAKHYEVVVSKYSYNYSDHVPVLFDFEIK